MKGVLLCGGTGSRLYPLTKCINKHLLPIKGKPMAQWNIEKMSEAGIKDILIVSGQDQCGSIIQQFGDGEDFGVNFTYRVQSKPGGIAQALSLAEHFCSNRYENICVVLGDNIFSTPLNGENFGEGAKCVLKKVDDPRRYGVPELKEGKIISITEKPKRPKSKYAVTGIYYFDYSVFEKIRNLKPSKRGEYEITDVLNQYIKENRLTYEEMSDTDFWSDAGTLESYAYVNSSEVE